MIRLAKIPAWYAKAMISRETTPEEWVMWCEVKEDGDWRRFTDYEDVDNHIGDWVDLISWSEQMAAYNIGFMVNFTFNKVSSEINAVSPRQLDPIFHSVMANGYATMHELRTVYSLEDVFLMLDSISTARKNEKLAYDAARQEANHAK